jgi:hypothetical protein
MRRVVAAVIAAAVVAIVIAVAALGASGEPRLAGSNGVDAGSFSVELRDGERYCQSGQVVPRTADRARMTIGSYDAPMPPVELTVTDGRGGTFAQRVTRPPEQGVVVLEMGRTTDRALQGADVCVRSQGGRIALGGFQDRARVEWLRPGEESLLGIAGTVLHRFDIGKPGWMGGWTLVVALLLAVSVFVLTARLLLREASRA